MWFGGASWRGLESYQLPVADRNHNRSPSRGGSHGSQEVLHLRGVRDRVISYQQTAGGQRVLNARPPRHILSPIRVQKQQIEGRLRLLLEELARLHHVLTNPRGQARSLK